jgi:hypothetical protein
MKRPREEKKGRDRRRDRGKDAKDQDGRRKIQRGKRAGQKDCRNT